MIPRRPFVLLLLASTAGLTFAQEAPPADAPAQQAVAEPDEDLPAEDDGEEIVVVGQKPRGSVVGDIPPENTLTSRDIRATGATSISELLDAVASQTGSARGRSSGRRSLLNASASRLPLASRPAPEAIERMEILPDEVALTMLCRAAGVNIVLRAD